MRKFTDVYRHNECLNAWKPTKFHEGTQRERERDTTEPNIKCEIKYAGNAPKNAPIELKT